MSVLMQVPCYLVYCCLVVRFEIGIGESSNFVILFFEILLAILGLLQFYINFRICLSRKPAGILTGIVFSLKINLGSIAILTVLSLLTMKMGGFPIYLDLKFLQIMFCCFQSIRFSYTFCEIYS